jgi:hypothetical protein
MREREREKLSTLTLQDPRKISCCSSVFCYCARLSPSILMTKLAELGAIVCVPMVAVCCLLIHLLRYCGGGGSFLFGPFCLLKLTSSSSISSAVSVIVLKPVSKVEFRSVLCDNFPFVLSPWLPKLFSRARRLLSLGHSLLPSFINSTRSPCIFMKNFCLLVSSAPSSSSAYTLWQQPAVESGRERQDPSVFPLIFLFFFLNFGAVELV